MSETKMETAMEKLENHFGKEILSRLVCDNTSCIDRTQSSGLVKLEQSSQDRVLTGDLDQLDLKRRQMLDEYACIETKQARTLSFLAKHVYRRLADEIAAGQRLIDAEDFHKVFYPVIELEKLASLVHEQVSNEVRARIESPDEWRSKPYAGDILSRYYHFYKIYKIVLQRYPASQITLSSCLKKKNFAAHLTKIIDVTSAFLPSFLFCAFVLALL
jgi:hypothetical protein